MIAERKSLVVGDFPRRACLDRLRHPYLESPFTESG